MSRITNGRQSRPAKRARDEATAAWDHLKAAAEQSASRVGDMSRRTSGIARERANNAALALRGANPRSRTRRWLGAGLALGAAIGAAGAAVLGRRRDHDSEPMIDTVREKATEAAHRAATSARDTAAKLSEATKPRPHGNGQPSQTASDAMR